MKLSKSILLAVFAGSFPGSLAKKNTETESDAGVLMRQLLKDGARHLRKDSGGTGGSRKGSSSSAAKDLPTFAAFDFENKFSILEGSVEGFGNFGLFGSFGFYFELALLGANLGDLPTCDNGSICVGRFAGSIQGKVDASGCQKFVVASILLDGGGDFYQLVSISSPA